jgi:hypothetical protein
VSVRQVQALERSNFSTGALQAITDFKSLQAEGSMEHVTTLVQEMKTKYMHEGGEYMNDLLQHVDDFSEAFLPMRLCGRLRTTSPNEGHHHRLKKQLSVTTSLSAGLTVLMKMKMAEDEIPVQTRPTRFPFLHEKTMTNLWHFLIDEEIFKSYSVKRMKQVRKSKRIKLQCNDKQYFIDSVSGECSCQQLHRRGYPCAHVISEWLKSDSKEKIAGMSSMFWKKNKLIRRCDQPQCHATYSAGHKKGTKSMISAEQESTEIKADTCFKACKRLLDFTRHPMFNEAIKCAHEGISEGLQLLERGEERIHWAEDDRLQVLSPCRPKSKHGREKRRLRSPFERKKKMPRKKRKSNAGSSSPGPTIRVCDYETNHSDRDDIRDHEKTFHMEMENDTDMGMAKECDDVLHVVPVAMKSEESPSHPATCDSRRSRKQSEYLSKSSHWTT